MDKRRLFWGFRGLVQVLFSHGNMAAKANN
jgi:hypothetical protein